MSDINTLMESLSKFNGKWPYQDAAEQLIKQQAEIISLREQVEKLTKERDELHRAFNQPVPRSEWEKMQEQLAALAEQNEKMRSFFEFAWKDIPMSEYAFEILEHVMNLPNLAAPALNRIRADGMRMAAQFIEDKYDFLGEEITVADEILARADELERSK